MTKVTRDQIASAHARAINSPEFTNRWGKPVWMKDSVDNWNTLPPEARNITAGLLAPFLENAPPQG